MIRYALVCDNGHRFDAWFRDSGSYDRQQAEGHVSCAACASPNVSKALMAPSVRRRTSGQERPDIEAAVPAVPEPAASEPPAVPDADKARHLRALLREMHGHVRANAENVGKAFADEARMIHLGESPTRAIYGTATGEQVRELHEDGIEVLPLPVLPDERN